MCNLMKRYSTAIFLLLICFFPVVAQNTILVSGKCNADVKWTFDGFTLQLDNISKRGLPAEIPDYDIKTYTAPWIKKKLNVKTIKIGQGISRIGSCAFANCKSVQEVIFEGLDLVDIAWGAFLGCTRLKTISLPVQLENIGKIAFANCSQIPSISIPDRCRVGDMAFVSCTGLQSIEIGSTTILGNNVFATERKVAGETVHNPYAREIRRIPPYVNTGNCVGFGLSVAAVENYQKRAKGSEAEQQDMVTSPIDEAPLMAIYSRADTYALIIGNQNYRFVGDVPYALHDARIFAQYCMRTLGLPVENVHVVEDATKQMLIEEELEGWVSNIPERETKKLIVYYAGHGVPDVKNHNKAYILPTDVRGTDPKRGIAIDDFYKYLNTLSFDMTTVFLDACFSGVNRDHEGVVEGLRGVEIDAEETSLDEGKMVVFAAAQGNETAQAYLEEGHGLFTYYLLKALNESGGILYMGDLADYLTSQVSATALQLRLRKKQTPTVFTSKALADTWRDIRL